MEELTQGYKLNNRYEIHEKIGEGGMAFVYRGVDLQTGENVALKILKKEFCYDEEFIQRFKNEAAAAQKLSHPNIVGIYDVGSDDDIQYIVREYIDGLSLDDLIKAKKKLPWRNTLKISAQILSAVDHAHKNKVIHRDIKPLNIMITTEGVVKLTDFGIARAVSSATKSAANDSAGSVHYLSPEQIRGGFVDERSDIYSIGITMYEMVTGNVPYDGDSHVSIAMKHIDGKIIPPSEVDPKIPYGVSDLIVLATKKETNMRFQSAGEMYDQLVKVMKNPYLSFLNDYAESDIPLGEETDDDTVLSQEGGEAISDYGIREEKNVMVRDVVSQTITYLAAVIVSVLVAFFVFTIFTSIKEDFKQYDVVEYCVQDYIGMEYDLVVSMLEEKGIEVKQEFDNSEIYPTGRIFRQSAEVGEILHTGDSVTLYIVKNPDDEIIGDYAGESFRAKGSELETKGFIVEYKALNSAKYADGKIIRTSPGEGKILEKGDKITIYYSTGVLNKTVEVPNLKGMTLEEAQNALYRKDLVLGVVYPSPSSNIDHLFPTPTPTETPEVTTQPLVTQTPAIVTGVPLETDVISTPDASSATQKTEVTEGSIPTDFIVPLTEEDVLTGEPTGEVSDATAIPENSPEGEDIASLPTATPTAIVTSSPVPTIAPTPTPTVAPTPTPVYAHDKVVAQYPPAGTQLMIGEEVNVYFYDLNDILPRKTLTMALPTVTPTPTDPNATSATMTPTPKPTPTVALDPDIDPNSLIRGKACAIRIEAKVSGMSKPAEIVFNSPALDLKKFPISFDVPVSITGAPTKVYIYIGEEGTSPYLYKVINVYG